MSKKPDPHNFRLPSGSRLELAEGCPGSHALPHASEWAERLQRGSLIHDYMAHGILAGNEAATAWLDSTEMPGDVENWCNNLDPAKIVDKLFPAGYDFIWVECKFQYDPWERKSYLLSRQGDPSPGAKWSPSRITNKLDVVAVYDGGKHLKVVDFKTGDPFGDMTMPKDLLQLQGQAVAAGIYFEAERVDVSIGFLRPNGELVERGPDKLDSMAIGAAAADLKAIANRVYGQQKTVKAGGVPMVIEGPWCKYCPALYGCPAKVGLFRGLMTIDTETKLPSKEDLVEMLKAMTPEEIGIAYGKMAHAKAMLDRAKESFKFVAAYAPILLPGGKKQVDLDQQERLSVDPVEFLARWKDECEPEQLGEAFRSDAISMGGVRDFAKVMEIPTEDVLEELEDEGYVDRRASYKLQPRNRHD